MSVTLPATKVGGRHVQRWELNTHKHLHTTTTITTATATATATNIIITVS
jgi:hypothetical protein